MVNGRKLSLKYTAPYDFELLDKEGNDVASKLMINKVDIEIGVGTLPEAKITTLIDQLQLDEIVARLDEDQLRLWAYAQGYNLVERE